jgi:putative heme-binding domain-containing protein
MARCALALSLTLAFALPATAQDPLPKVPEGFKIELVLKAPNVEHPTALAVAPNGDVYYAEDPMDMRGPSNKNADKIYMLKGGDPKQRVLIAEQMWAVMGMEVVGDKLFVVHYPYISVFTLDADGKAAKREDLFTDVGPKSAPPGGFNDHVPSGIRMGMDGFLYVSIGDKGIPKMTRRPNDPITDGIEVAEGRVRKTKDGRFLKLEGGGVIRFRPDGTRLEVFASGTRNHLDVPMDEQDRIFVRDNTDDGDGWNTRFMYLVKDGFYGYPWAFTRHPRETLPIIHDFGGGSPCQGWVYCDDGLPEKYRGRVFHCEWGKGKIYAVKVQRDGAGYKYVDEITFVDPSGTGVKDFRPYSIRPTADGKGFYITDWAFSGWMQKAVVGRIYKVTYTKGDVQPAARGTDADSVEQLLKSLDHPAHSERLRAQRLLIARGKEARPAVLAALEKKALGVAGRRHAVWILGEVGGDNWMVEGVVQATHDADSGVRAQAVRVLGTCPWQSKKQPGDGDADLLNNLVQINSRLTELLKSDPDAQVRMCAAQSLHMANGRVPLLLMAKESDRYVRFTVAMRLRQECDWDDLRQQLSAKEPLKLEPASLELLFHALADQYEPRAVAVVKTFLDHADPAVRKRAIEVLGRVSQDRKPYAGGWWGTRPEKQKPPARTIAWEGTPLVRDSLLAALGDGDEGVRKAAVGGMLALNDPKLLEPLMQRFDAAKGEAERQQLVAAIASIKQPQVVAFLAAVAVDGARSLPVRAEAVAGLKAAGSDPAVQALVQVFAQAKDPSLLAQTVEALGALKAKAGRPVLEKSLKHQAALVRQRGAEALGNSGDTTVVPLLAPLVDDADAPVREAAVKALGELKAPAAVPVLLKAVANADLQFEAITALTKTPDLRALSAYLTGLQSKNATLRQASRQALAAIRHDAAPLLEELAKRNELPQDVVPELRTVYEAYAPVGAWKLIGPFPDDDKSYPPEKEQKFNATYKGVGGDVKWQTRKADLKNHGKVDLFKMFTPNTEVSAYGYAEINSDSDRDARLLIGSDDSIVVWLNGEKVHEFTGSRGWKFDADNVKVRLKKGQNTLLIRCGNKSGPWEFSVGVSGETSQYAFLKAGGKKIDLEAFRAFARKTPGDAARGEKLFLDLKGVACVKCHAVAGQGGKVGPDLAGIALRYKKEDLMTSILEPSKQIANGYETHVITTTSGNVITGIFKGDDGDAITIMDADGKEHRILKKNIDDRKTSPISTMPNGLSDGMTLQDFADLIAYLEARREELTRPPDKKGDR